MVEKMVDLTEHHLVLNLKESVCRISFVPVITQIMRHKIISYLWISLVDNIATAFLCHSYQFTTNALSWDSR